MVHQKCVFLFQTFEDVSVGIFQRIATEYGKRYFHSRQNVCAVRRMKATILIVENDRLIRDFVSEALHQTARLFPKLVPSSRNGMTSLGPPSFIAKTKTALWQQTLTPKVSALIYGGGTAESHPHTPQVSTRICWRSSYTVSPPVLGWGDYLQLESDLE